MLWVLVVPVAAVEETFFSLAPAAYSSFPFLLFSLLPALVFLLCLCLLLVCGSDVHRYGTCLGRFASCISSLLHTQRSNSFYASSALLAFREILFLFRPFAESRMTSTKDFDLCLSTVQQNQASDRRDYCTDQADYLHGLICITCVSFHGADLLDGYELTRLGSVGYLQNHTQGIYPGITLQRTSVETFIPVPGTSVSSVPPVSQIPGVPVQRFCTCPELL